MPVRRKSILLFRGNFNLRRNRRARRRMDREPEQAERLAKAMAARGLCSRREADGYIANGWVYVDGERAEVPYLRVGPEQVITLDPAATGAQTGKVTVLLNKPVGYVSGQPEKGYRPAVELVTPENRFSGDAAPLRFEWAHLKGLAPAGRLDIDSHGLLVFTQDGRVARRLVGGTGEVDKEYLVRVEGEITEAKLGLLRFGLELDGRQLRPAEVELQHPGLLHFVLREGRKRQIRRMCAAVGLTVTSLKRVRIGGVRLENLPEGQWRYLAPGENF